MMFIALFAVVCLDKTRGLFDALAFDMLCYELSSVFGGS